jgi:hypothetical protein
MSSYFSIPEDRSIQDYFFEVTDNGLLSVTDIKNNATNLMTADIAGIKDGERLFTPITDRRLAYPSPVNDLNRQVWDARHPA